MPKFTRAHILCLAQLALNDELLVLSAFRTLLAAHGINDTNPSLLQVHSEMLALCNQRESTYSRERWSRVPEHPFVAYRRLCHRLLNGQYPDVHGIDEFRSLFTKFLNRNHGKRGGPALLGDSVGSADPTEHASAAEVAIAIRAEECLAPDDRARSPFEESLDAVLRGLTADERAVVVARALEAATWDEVVRRTGLGLSTAKRRFSSGIDKLEERYKA